MRWRISTTYDDELTASSITADEETLRRYVQREVTNIIDNRTRITAFTVELVEEEN